MDAKAAEQSKGQLGRSASFSLLNLGVTWGVFRSAGKELPIISSRK